MNNGENFEAARNARRITEQAATWYIEQHDEPDERSKAAFLAWLRESPAHVAEYLAIAQMHGDLKAAASMEALSSSELVEWVGRANPVVMFPRAGARPSDERQAALPRKPRRRRAVAGLAAVAALLALALLGGLHWRETRMDLQQSFAAEGALQSLELPDGTLVQLAQDSAINVHFNAHYRRIDVMRGNALFDVAHDPARPLLVSVGGHVLQDIGTVFDVKRDTGGDTLTVISGRVRVWNASRILPDEQKPFVDNLEVGGDAVADLIAGQQVELGAGNVETVRPAEIAKVTAWLPRDIHFQHETVGDVARRFNAYTTMPLVIEDSDIADMRISGVFHANNPQAFMAYLATLPGVRVVQGGDRVRIVASSSRSNARSGKL